MKVKNKLILCGLLLFSITSCEKEDWFDLIEGIYEAPCRYVQYSYDSFGNVDSTVHTRTIIAIVSSGSTGNTELFLERIRFSIPGIEEKVPFISYKDNIATYQMLYDPTPDGVNDTLTVRINISEKTLQMHHKGNSDFYINGEVITLTDFLHTCNGVKIE